MARVDNLSNFLTDIASAIRTKTGKTTNITPNNFDLEIQNIPSAQTFSPKIISFAHCWGTNLADLVDMNMLDISYVNGFGGLFCHSGILNIDAVASWNTSNITNMMWLCNRAYYRYNLNFMANWNTKNVTRIDCAFDTCYHLNNIDVFSTLNWGNVDTMPYLFNSCSNLINVNLSNLNFGKADTLTSCFGYCRNLQQLNMTNVNLYNVQNFYGFCYNCTNVININLSNWSTGSSLQNLSYMFYNCRNLVNLNMAGWNLNSANVNSIRNMFYYCNNLSNSSYASIANALPMATNLTNKYLANSGLNIGRLTYNEMMILNNKGYIDVPLPIYNIYIE